MLSEAPPTPVCLNRVFLAEAWLRAPRSWPGEEAPVREALPRAVSPGSLGFTLLPLTKALKSRALTILNYF